MPIEISLNGVYVPPWLLTALLGLLAAWVIAQFANILGLSRWVWHPPLFFATLVLLCTLGIGSFFLPSFFA
jgi:hypothetical protein